INVAFDKFFIRPEINFVSNKNSYDFPTKTSQWSASKIDVPLLFGYKVYDPIAIYIGPSFSFFNKMTLEGANNNSNPNPTNFEKTTTSLMFGIQVEFKRFGVDLRYETGLKETAEEFNDFISSTYGINLATYMLTNRLKLA
ncbi:MAG: outer membrane beta-barrel protein, partial [Bacteroidetes bacterium]|nr:outer membrane beta-barrel protein [Bacteroidota bacterium]